MTEISEFDDDFGESMPDPAETLAEGQEGGRDLEFVKRGQEQHVVFTLRDQTFGIEIQNVVEVQKIDQVSDVFHTPDFVVGVVNIRGDIVTLLDIGLFFGMPKTEWDEDKKMVIVQHESMDAGFLAEEMKGVERIKEEEIESPPPTVAGISSEWIEGIIQQDGKPLIILDIPTIFESKRIEDL
jgi:purine-binding chemotaxis protein CheW